MPTFMRAALVILGLLSVGTPAAQAAPTLYWSVSGTFDDGTNFSGIFATNVYGFLQPPLAITTEDGIILGAVYPQPGAPSASIDNATKSIVVFNRPGYNGFFELDFLYDLTVYPASGVNPIVIGALSYECNGYQFAIPNDPASCTRIERYVVSGLATVAEPAALPLIAGALIGLALFSRRQRALAPAGRRA
ncbi:MAG: hypothetical protein JNL66_17220 [Alphaproteobacteria bacterium]|nr:hypothetical protein [Alphaproteobacteria bacterium]